MGVLIPEVIAQARSAGLELTLTDDRVRLVGRASHQVLVETLRQRADEVRRWLALEAAEEAWREQVFRSLIPARGPVPFLKLDGAGAAGCCIACYRLTMARDWQRCSLCLRALRAALGVHE